MKDIVKGMLRVNCFNAEKLVEDLSVGGTGFFYERILMQIKKREILIIPETS